MRAVHGTHGFTEFWTRGGRASGKRRVGTLLVLTMLLTLGSTIVALAAGFNLTTIGAVQKINEAVYRAYNPAEAAGSGVFDAFVRVSANTDVVQGYNTDARPLTYDENNAPGFTRSYRLSNIPIVADPDYPGVYREFQLDINQNGGSHLSLDEVEIYLSTAPAITGFITSTGFISNTVLVYKLDKAPGGNNWLELNGDLSAGSGKRDLLLRVPNANFTGVPLGADPNCTYQGLPPAGSACNTFVVLYSRFGGDAGVTEPTTTNNDGFEEWGVQVYDLATASGLKFHDLDADGVKDAGEPGLAGWTVYVDINDNGQFDTGEPSALTDSNGVYTIDNIVQGGYKVREVQQAGWTCSFPNNSGSDLQSVPVISSTCFYSQTFGAGSDLTGDDFGNYALEIPTVTKTATTVFTRTNTYEWDLLKTVTPATSHLFEGESGTFTYTVIITPSITPADSGHKVSGAIVITNPGPGISVIADIDDVVAGSYPAPVTCTGVTFPKLLTAGQTLNCSYALEPGGQITGTNIVTVTLANSTTVQATAPVAFGQPSTVINIGDEVTVEDNYTINGSGDEETLDTDISEAWSKTYTRTVNCESNLDYVNGVADFDADNTASIVDTEVSDTAHADIFCYQPSVTKTVQPSDVLTYTWTIGKKVTPSQTDLFEGDETTLDYTVQLTRTLVDQAYRVTGTITISNPNPVDALSLNVVSDLLNSGQTLPVNCNGSTTVPANGKLVCTYGGDLDSNKELINTATAVAFTGLFYTHSALVNFDKAPTTEILGEVDVNDTQPSSDSPWEFTGSGSQQYSHKVTCDDNAFNGGDSYTIPVDNTATIVQTQQSDSANATVTCWRLSVSLNAAPSYTRPYAWTIQKSVTPSLIVLVPGESEDAQYTVTVTKTALAPTNLLVTGNVVVANRAPMAALLASLSDKLGNANVALNCGVDLSQGISLAGNTSLNCTFSHTPSSTANTSNTATATLSNGKSFSGTGVVDFSRATITSLLPQVDVTDSNLPETWTFTQSGQQSYALTFDCADANFDETNTSTVKLPNTATIVRTGASDTAEVTRICQVGDLQVIKAVDWNDATPDQNQSFEICIEGPSFPNGNEAGACQAADFDGGALNWANLIPGSYSVTETDPGSDWTVSGSGVSVNVPADGSAQTTITNLHQPPLGSIGNFVWEDLNENGLQDDDEPAVPNVTVNLLDPGDNGQCDVDDEVLETTTTDTNGEYLFDNLEAGDYCVQFVAPDDFDFTTAGEGSDPALDSDADGQTGLSGVITLPPGGSDSTLDGGLFQTNPTGLDPDDQPVKPVQIFLPSLNR